LRALVEKLSQQTWVAVRFFLTHINDSVLSRSNQESIPSIAFVVAGVIITFVREVLGVVAASGAGNA
jgi:hypothetical protein